MNDFVQLFNKLTQTKYHANTTFFFLQNLSVLEYFPVPCEKKKKIEK